MNPTDVQKVLHVTFNMEIGGTEQVIKQLVLGADARRFDHEVLCIDGRIGSIGAQLQALGFRVHSLKRKPGFDFELIRGIRSLVRSSRIDVLHCHQYTPFSYGVLAALGVPVRVIFTEHGRFFPDRHYFKRLLVNPLLATRAQHISAISKATADALARYDYMPHRRIKVIYNGIEDVSKGVLSRESLLDELGLSPSQRYVGTIARLQPIKNQELMLRAFESVSRVVPDLELIIIGDGPSRKHLEVLADQLGLVESVHFPGFLENPQKFMQVFEVFLLSSLSEGTSMTLLEAMSFGKPCIATDVGGNPEVVVDGKTGLVTPSDDVHGFAAAILDLVSNEGKQLEMGKAGRRRFEQHFSLSCMTDQYQHLYQVTKD